MSAEDFPQQRSVLVCQSRSCQRQGAEAVLAKFQRDAPNGVLVIASDCMGQCSSSVTVRVLPENTWYCRVQADTVPLIIQQHLCDHQPVTALLHPRFHPKPVPSAPETPPRVLE
jgi:(2Fe-2S) ferredoxin